MSATKGGSKYEGSHLTVVLTQKAEKVNISAEIEDVAWMRIKEIRPELSKLEFGRD